MTITGHERLVLTGAAGGLAQALRERLKADCITLRLYDRVLLGAAREGEELVLADLADTAQVQVMVAGVGHTDYFRNVQHAATCWDTTRAPCGLCTHESSELHREAIVARTAAPGADLAVPQQGGAFVRIGPFE